MGQSVHPSSAPVGAASGTATVGVGPLDFSSLDVLSRSPLHWRVNRAHPGPVLSVAFGTTPAGSPVLASAGTDGTVRLWDLADPSATPTVLSGHTGEVLSVAFGTTPAGSPVLASAGADGTVRLWDLADPSATPTVLSGHTGEVRSVAFGTTPAGSPVLASASADGTVRLWDLADPSATPTVLSGHTGAVWSVAFGTTPAGSPVLASASTDGTVRLWDLADPSATPTVLSGHTGEVLSVAFGTTPAGSPVLASAGTDGTVRLWDLADPSATPTVLSGHTGEVSSVAFGTTPAGSPVLASAGTDGTVRLWDLADPSATPTVLSGHTGAVWSVAFGTTPAGSPVLASAGADGTVRLWDLADPSATPTVLSGHTGEVLSVAFGTTPAGSPVLASASTDATVRLWDLADPSATPTVLSGHTGAVWSVAFGTTPAGSPVLASASTDATVRLWDLADPSATPTVLSGHTGAVWSVAFGTTPAGSLVLASASSDGTVRLWDLADPSATPTVLSDHTGEVSSVAFGTTPAGSPVLASAGTDGTIDLRAVTSGGVSDGPIPVPDNEPPEPRRSPLAASRAALVSGDDEETADTLGRQVLAGHLAGVLQQLAGSRGGRDRSGGTVVISVDGRWGSGKSVLARLCAEQLAGPAPPSGRSGTSAAAPVATPGPGDLHDPVVVWFDAWRESSVGPRWWALGAALKRGVESERAGGTRLAMAAVGLWHRLARSRAAALAAVAVLLAWWLSRSSSWDTLSKVIAAATTASGLAIGLGRALFWASPAVGKLYLTADGNPLDEISGIVARLRRWSPRQGRRHRLADTLLGIWIVLTSAYLVHALVFDNAARGTVSGVPSWVLSTWAGWWPAILAGLGVGMLTSTALHVGPPPSAAAQGANRPGDPVAGAPWSPTGLAAVSVAAAAGTMLAVQRLPRPWWMTTHAVVVGAVALVAGAAAYLWWLSRGLDQPRRPILLVIDDLDRCSAEDTVDYLETVHTLLRYNHQPRVLPRWRQPAPLLVLALGDGRWVRQAFEKRYETFAPLGDPARNLGADFIQKLFDHTVLVPELTQEQVRRYVALVTESPTTSAGDRPVSPPSPGSPPASGAEAEVGASAPAVEPSSGESSPRAAPAAASDEAGTAYPTQPTAAGRAQAAGARRPTPALPPEVMQQIERDTAEARSKASEAVVAARSRHLLSDYPGLMPANPRLIRRVVNMWGMLDALTLHLRHGHEDEELVRAAVFFVRFPTLVDELISTQKPPSPEDLTPDRWSTPDPGTTQWRRRDVLEVLRLNNGTYLAPKTLGECYGRRYPAAPTFTPTPAPVPAAAPEPVV